MEPMEKVPCTTCGFKDSRYGENNGDFWRAPTLYAAAKKQKCKRFKLPLRHIDLSWNRFTGDRVIDMAYYYKRIVNTDLKIPVLMSPVGNILDGAHRLVKAVAEGRTFVWCYRLKEMPKIDGNDKEK